MTSGNSTCYLFDIARNVLVILLNTSRTSAFCVVWVFPRNSSTYFIIRYKFRILHLILLSLICLVKNPTNSVSRKNLYDFYMTFMLLHIFSFACIYAFILPFLFCNSYLCILWLWKKRLKWTGALLLEACNFIKKGTLTQVFSHKL